MAVQYNTVACFDDHERTSEVEASHVRKICGLLKMQQYILFFGMIC